MPKQNRAQASKKSQYEAKVSQLDSLGTNAGEFVQQEGMTAIENACGEFIDRVQANIESHPNMITTGGISDITLVSKDGGIEIHANKQLIFQDRGVNGSVVQLYDTPHAYSNKKPPIAAFVEWIKKKKSFLTDKNDYHRKYDKTDSGKERPFKELTEEQKITNAAYAVREKVFQEGFAPKNLYSKELPKLISDVEKELANFVMQSIIQVVDVKPEAKRIIIK